jgi:hypothetical protein
MVLFPLELFSLEEKAARVARTAFSFARKKGLILRFLIHSQKHSSLSLF